MYIKKGYDSVPHACLVEGAFQRCVRGRALKFLIAILSCRAYRIRAGNTLSPKRTKNIGLPPDSVLSPMLFNLASKDYPVTSAKYLILDHTIYADYNSI